MNEQAKPVHYYVLEGSNRAFNDELIRVLDGVKYKPATCNGIPAKGIYIFRLNLGVVHYESD
jgi:hypothetical protein